MMHPRSGDSFWFPQKRAHALSASHSAPLPLLRSCLDPGLAHANPCLGPSFPDPEPPGRRLLGGHAHGTPQDRSLTGTSNQEPISRQRQMGTGVGVPHPWARASSLRAGTQRRPAQWRSGARAHHWLFCPPGLPGPVMQQQIAQAAADCLMQSCLACSIRHPQDRRVLLCRQAAALAVHVGALVC